MGPIQFRITNRKKIGHSESVCLRKASIGQAWTRHLAPTAPAVTAFIAISVLPAVRLSICLPMGLIVLFPTSLDGARTKACWFWAYAGGGGGIQWGES